MRVAKTTMAASSSCMLMRFPKYVIAAASSALMKNPEMKMLSLYSPSVRARRPPMMESAQATSMMPM